MTSEPFTCGDILVFSKTNGPLLPIKHYAVYVGNSEIVHYNPVQVAHQDARKVRGQSVIRRENIEEYLKRFAVTIISVDHIMYMYVVLSEH